MAVQLLRNPAWVSRSPVWKSSLILNSRGQDLRVEPADLRGVLGGVSSVVLALRSSGSRSKSMEGVDQILLHCFIGTYTQSFFVDMADSEYFSQ